MDVWRSGDVLPKYSRSRIKEPHVVPKRNRESKRERERERKYHSNNNNYITSGCAVCWRTAAIRDQHQETSVWTKSFYACSWFHHLSRQYFYLLWAIKHSQRLISCALTCFGVCCNEYIIWPGLKVLDLLPAVCEIVDHCDSLEIKHFRSGEIHLLCESKTQSTWSLCWSNIMII